MNKTQGAIHSTKISGNFGPKLNGSVRSNRKSFEKTGPPFEVVLFSRSDRSEFWLNGSRPQSFVRRLQSVAWKPIMHLTSLLWMTSRRTPTKLDRFIARRKSRWPCDACVVHARFARTVIINLASRGITLYYI